MSSVVGVHARSKSDVDSVAASQQASSFSDIGSPYSTRVAFSSPEVSRKTVVVVVILVHVSSAKVKAVSEINSELHASISGSL